MESLPPPVKKNASNLRKSFFWSFPKHSSLKSEEIRNDKTDPGNNLESDRATFFSGRCGFPETVKENKIEQPTILG